ncbi:MULTISPECIES: SDR family oxidoreductase [unclassified Bradyrhizobium]|uniref:SDR family oxidoreductase n=1 Tax=unclassified Bradyrhizobium TaxID=2631580 RepID=UPI001BA9C242|nr:MULTISPECIES: SDR family oxidoreductase [unclassified Bradyrhizobium]MBR1223427.1 SDR family oxidoreductase [Bradyrhizobium sp. AUGA SZCCT0176]MBR1298858.1 SDR family oxidoreductase [Bradyrhizobium sp. AUGA SZCCT0042]
MNSEVATRKILVLGASGLIGRYITDDLRLQGFQAVGVARHFEPSQKTGASDLELPIMSMDAASLARLIREREIDVVVNCLGVLQDGPGSDTRAVHRDFVERLLAALRDSGRAVRFVHISIPGTADEDRTAFSTTKREAERLIAASGIPYAILRPGFVVAPSAYGGSALLRALAAFPLQLPGDESATPFQPVAVEDVSATITWLATRDIDDPAANAVTWDLMQPQPITLGNVIDQFRWSFGTSHMPRITLPGFLLNLGAKSGDLANRLGWMPPMRSTAIAELRRGVTGDSASWMAATGIVPKTLAQAVGGHAATIQDKWFARLFLVKALVIASLAVFWIVSGFISLVISFSAAADILRAHGFPQWLVAPMTAITSLMDMSIGVLIAFRRTAAVGLIAGIVVALGYMVGAAILTPDLWIEPLGALVKTGPAIVLMFVALLTLDNR